MELRGAEVEGAYTSDWYAGQPCLTRHTYGKARRGTWAAKADQNALNAFYRRLQSVPDCPRAMDTELPYGVVAVERGGVVFLQNYSGKERTVALDKAYHELLTDRDVSGEVTLPICGVMVLK